MGCGQKMVPLANEILPDILQKNPKGPFLCDNQQLKDHKFSFQIPSHYQHNTSNGYFGKNYYLDNFNSIPIALIVKSFFFRKSK